MNKDEIMEVLSTIKYPGYSKSITDFKVVKEVKVNDKTIEILLNLGTASDEKRKIIYDEIRQKLAKDGFEVKISTVQEKGTTVEQKHFVSNAKKRIAVLSAKGGVGKSTFAVSLAIALNRRGNKVGLFDADIHGPDVPRMLGLQQPARADKEKNMIIPNEKNGIYSMSLGYVVDPETPVIWKGAMVSKAIVELLQFTAWPEMDYFIVDLPPGTGDAALSINQNMDLDAAIIVTTPNSLAIMDAARATAYYNQLGTKVIGFVENSGYFVCDECGKKSYPFGNADPVAIETQLKVPCLGVLPFEPKIEEASDNGDLFSALDTEFFKIMDSIAEKIEKD
ncbi:Mrp/NBP35 family ATP-binding protein [Mesoaciditoga sp.]